MAMQVEDEETHATGGLAATLAQEVAHVAQLANEYYGIMGRACVQLERNLYYRQLVNTPPEYRISDERIAINVSQMYPHQQLVMFSFFGYEHNMAHWLYCDRYVGLASHRAVSHDVTFECLRAMETQHSSNTCVGCGNLHR